jgi:hypothetical protein
MSNRILRDQQKRTGKVDARFLPKPVAVPPQFSAAELKALWDAVSQYLDNSCGEECEGNPLEPAARSAAEKLDAYMVNG